MLAGTCRWISRRALPVVTEEDTPERGKRAHEVRLPCDGGFDLVDIVSRPESDRVLARHDCWIRQRHKRTAMGRVSMEVSKRSGGEWV